MALNPPLKNKPGLAAWRRGYWDQRKQIGRRSYQGRSRGMQRFYNQGHYEAGHAPGAFHPACFTEQMLMIIGLQFCIKYAATVIPKDDPTLPGMVEAMVPGWETMLIKAKAKVAAKDKKKGED